MGGSSIDVLISPHHEKTGREDAELHKLKGRMLASREHLEKAVSVGRECLKSFGSFVEEITGHTTIR